MKELDEMAVNLDDGMVYERLDPSTMQRYIAELPRQCAAAWELARDWKLPASYGAVKQVVILGMGGSAIGGALLAGLERDVCPIPVHGVNDYTLPAYADADTLVVASSHSGNTEETLSAFGQAIERGCRLVAVTTGGKLSALAADKGIPQLQFTYPTAPRAALGYSFTLLLGLFCRLGLLPDRSGELSEAIALLETLQSQWAPNVPTAENPAKRLATRLHGRLPVIYGAGFLGAVARRWKGQFNENSKVWAFYEELPELGHNAIVGYGLPTQMREQVTVICLRSPLDHPRVQLRWEITRELLLQEGIAVETLHGQGASRLAQMLSLIHQGDYVSLYLALKNGADPTAMRPIEYLKQRLADIS